MTNVPEIIRNALADAYKLFDVSFNMTGTDDEWEQYWKHGTEMVKKYGDEIPLLKLLMAYAGIIETVINQRKTGNRSLLWNKDENYPHPK